MIKISNYTAIPSRWLRVMFWLIHFLHGCLYIGKGLKWFLQAKIKRNKSIQKGINFIRKKWRKHDDMLIFLKAWIKNPITMGAVAPSSQYLAHEMVSHCEADRPGIIIELGAGTGVVTAALLQKGVSPQRLVVLEYSPVLVDKLRRQFPNICVLEGSAINLVRLLKDDSRPIYAIVSSLPLRAFSQGMTKTVLEQITTLLPSHSKYIQFTYSLRKTRYTELAHYYLIASKRIWRNLPPARVDVWEAQK